MVSPNSTLAHVQQAGQAVSTAREQLNLQLQRQVDKLATVVVAQPFGSDADRAYAQLRAVARMAQELQSIEDQLVQVYKAAAQFEEAQDIQILVALPRHKAKAASITVGAATKGAVDAQEVLPRQRTPKSRTVKPSRAQPKTTATATTTTSAQRRSLGATNEDRLLAGLKQHLNKRSWTPMTQAQMAQITGLPQGSVGAALNRVIASGRVIMGERGQYKLG